MCHPFVTSPFSNPSQQALPLCDCCYACGLPQHWDCVCVCAFMQEFVCTCVLLPWQIYSNPGLPASIGGDGGGEGGREQGPLKDSPPSPLSSRLQPTAPQPSWHLPWDRLNELKEIQWDTWCSSQGAPLLLHCATTLCPKAPAQRRAHRGQSKGSKNTQYATVYQDDLSSSPNTKPSIILPSIPPHLSADLPSTSLAPLMLHPFRPPGLLIDRVDEIKYRGRESERAFVQLKRRIQFVVWLIFISFDWIGVNLTWAKLSFNNRLFHTHFPNEFCLLVAIATFCLLISALRTWARCFIMIISCVEFLYFSASF